ncbi:MAG: c-type cytochrome, partial [Marinirhabdus sp.]
MAAVLLTAPNPALAQDPPVEDTTTDVASVAAPETPNTGTVGDPTAGEALFKANCAACHKLDKRATGPAIRGAADKYDREWLYAWISNSQALVQAGDPQAVQIFEEFNGSVMTPFPALSTTDIDNILAYTSLPKPEPTIAALPAGAESSGGGGISNSVVLAALALILLLLIAMLFLVTNTLKKIATANGVQYPEKPKHTPIWQAFVQNQFLVLVSAVFLLLASGYFMYGYMMQVGVDQGYAPVQPIHYSHKVHAGANEID